MYEVAESYGAVQIDEGFSTSFAVHIAAKQKPDALIKLCIR